MSKSKKILSYMAMAYAIIAAIISFIDQNWLTAMWTIVAFLNMVECYRIEYCYYAQEKYLDELIKEYYNSINRHRKEVKELKEEIEFLQEQYKSCFDGFLKRGTKLGELMKENVKLKKIIDKN